MPVALPSTGSDYSTAQATSGTSLAPAKPVNTADNDLLWCYTYFRNATTTPTPPAGWSSIGISSTAHPGFQLFTKQITTAAGEPGTYTFTADAGGRCGVTLGRITGHRTTTPVDVVGTVQDAVGSSNVVTPSISTSASDDLLICLTVANIASATPIGITPDAALTELVEVDVSSTSSSSLSVGFASFGAPGATGTRTQTFDATASSRASVLVAFAAQVTYQAGRAPFSAPTPAAHNAATW